MTSFIEGEPPGRRFRNLLHRLPRRGPGRPAELPVFDLSEPGTEQELYVRALFLVHNSSDGEIVEQARQVMADYRRLNKHKEGEKPQDEPGYDGMSLSAVMGEPINKRQLNQFVVELKERLGRTASGTNK